MLSRSESYRGLRAGERGGGGEGKRGRRKGGAGREEAEETKNTIVFRRGKLKCRWSGPFSIAQVFPYGTVELSQTDGPNFKVNDHRLKHYFGGDIPHMVVLDLQTFPKDQ
ncbi:hypothetical protein Tco_0563917 [Tanacetum coccineum]